jgi:hypothetical protein
VLGWCGCLLSVRLQRLKLFVRGCGLLVCYLPYAWGARGCRRCEVPAGCRALQLQSSFILTLRRWKEVKLRAMGVFSGFVDRVCGRQ